MYVSVVPDSYSATDNSYVEYIYGTYENKKYEVTNIAKDPTVPNIGSFDNAYVGYMYGTVGSSTYALTHANTNHSEIKLSLDTWYQNNLASYSNYLADVGFCNDRSISNGLGYGTNTTGYGAYKRLNNLNQPQFACPQSNDLFTTSSSSKGNKALTYPIGLLTADEVTYAGGRSSTTNENFYLVNGSFFWTMSPRAFASGHAAAWYVNDDGNVRDDFVDYAGGVRPAINLKSNVEITSGDGTEGRPYTIKVN